MENTADPLGQLAMWLAEAMAQAGHNHDAMALATADSQGCPDVRYVLLKRVSAAGLEFFTNRGSSKAGQLEERANAAACLYWPGLARQVRARGLVRELDRARVAEYFATRSRDSQLGAWASQQSTTLADRTTLEECNREVTERFAGIDVPVPDFWTGYNLAPLAIEFWQEGKARLHERILHERDGLDVPWQVRRLFP